MGMNRTIQINKRCSLPNTHVARNPQSAALMAATQFSPENENDKNNEHDAKYDSLLIHTGCLPTSKKVAKGENRRIAYMVPVARHSPRFSAVRTYIMNF
jgi:hypothetical protein